MILLIDNYDSFTYNLVQTLAGQGAEIEVYRNDAITVEEVLQLYPKLGIPHFQRGLVWVESGPSGQLYVH